MATTTESKVFWQKFKAPTPEELLVRHLNAIRIKYPDDRADLVVKDIQARGLLNDVTKAWLQQEMGLVVARIPSVTLAGFPLGSFEVSNGMYCYPAVPINEDAYYKQLEREEYYNEDDSL